MEIDTNNLTALEKVTFPSGSQEDTVPAKVCREYNRLRQENMLKKIKDVEMSGSIAIVTPGASHAYSLKLILERDFISK